MKYLHIVMDHYYSIHFIKFINEKFEPRNHFFLYLILTRNFKNENLKNYSNIFYLNLSKIPPLRMFSKSYIQAIKLIKKSDHVIIHGLNSDNALLTIFGKKKQKSTSWITWGSDIYHNIPIKLYDIRTEIYLNKNKTYLVKNYLSKFIQTVLLTFKKYFIKKLDYIVNYSEREYLLIRKFFTTNARHIKEFNYPHSSDFNDATSIVDVNIEKYYYKNKYKKLILIGNSAHPTNNHVDMFYILKEIEDQDFGIICPLSYNGPKSYIDYVILTGNELFGDRFIPILEFVSFNVYLNILKQVDIVIWNHNRPQGLGNLRILFKFEKKIYMKKNILYKDLIDWGFEILSYEDLLESIKNKQNIFEYSEKFKKNAEKVDEFFSNNKAELLISTFFKKLNDWGDNDSKFSTKMQK